jgi:hypothetical protein
MSWPRLRLGTFSVQMYRLVLHHERLVWNGLEKSSYCCILALKWHSSREGKAVVKTADILFTGYALNACPYEYSIMIRKQLNLHYVTFRLTNTINTRGKQLVLQLTEVCDAKQRTLKDKKVALEQLSNLTDHCIDFVNNALNKGSDMALLYSKR